jgi:hypothetical protein
MNEKFKKELEKLLNKNEESLLASYIKKCLNDYDSQINNKENPFGVELQQPNPNPQPIAANVGNTTTTGWSNPFGGTSWGV